MIRRSLVVTDVKQVDFIEEEINDELKPTEVMFETFVSYISPGTELSFYTGTEVGLKFPAKPGYCQVGKVIKKGSEVKEYEIGDVCVYGGGHQSHVVYDVTSALGKGIHKLGKDTTYEEGAFSKMCIIAANAIAPINVAPGDDVVVIGLGTLGVIVAQLYRLAGAHVVAFDPMESRCEMARKAGIKEAYSCSPEEQIEKANELSSDVWGANGANIVVEATGIPACFAAATKMAARFGQIILLGSPRVPCVTDITPIAWDIHSKMLTVIGALNTRYALKRTSYRETTDIERIASGMERLLADKLIDVNLFISHRIKPTKEDFKFAYEGLLNDKENFTGVVCEWK